MDRAHFVQLSNAFPEALILLSGSGEVLAANASAARQLGIPKSPPDGTRLEQFVEKPVVDQPSFCLEQVTDVGLQDLFGLR